VGTVAVAATTGVGVVVVVEVTVVGSCRVVIVVLEVDFFPAGGA
jgi:hypothetical protein